MYVLVVSIDIQPGFKGQHVGRCSPLRHRGARCVRLNVIHNEEETIGISLYEACRDMAPFDHRRRCPISSGGRIG